MPQLTALDRLSQMSDGEVQLVWSLLTDIDWNAPGPYSDTPTMTDWVYMVYTEMNKRGLDVLATLSV